MGLRTMVLVLLQLVAYGAAGDLDIICQIQLQLPIESALTKELCSCDMFIVNSVTFDIEKSTVLTREELSRIDTIKRCNSSADVLLTIVLPFNVTTLSVHQQLSERINIVLRDNVLDGVDLDYDISLLDYYQQLRYGQFLRRLRTILSDKYAITTTIGCHTMGSSNALLKSFNDHLDLVSVVGVNMLEDELVDRTEEEFMLREYGTELIARLLQDGLRAEKIVLSVLTVGVVFNPSKYRVTRSLQHSHVGVLSYGQICELLQEKQSKCGSRASSTRPACSLFAGNGAIVYDNDKTVQKRVHQAHSLGVRGVLILPNYDDSENVCNDGPFPLFRTILDTVAKIEMSDDRDVLVCDTKQRYGDTEDRTIYYTYANGRFQQNRCIAGSNFNERLQLCTSDEYPPIVLMDRKRVATTEVPCAHSSTELNVESTHSSTSNSEVTETFPTFASLEHSLKSAAQRLESALTYLDNIISKVLRLMQRMEGLEQSLRDETMSPESTQSTKVIKSSTQTDGEVGTYPTPSSLAMEETETGESTRLETTVSSSILESSLIPVLALYALLTQAGWDHRLKWRPLWHIPKYLRINFALVVSLLTIYSNLAAIVGLLTYRMFLLWPYICLHLGTFALELWYLVGKKLALLPSVCLRKFDLNVCQNETDKWWSPLMVFLPGFNLSIVIAVYLHVDGLKPDVGTVPGAVWNTF